MRRKKTFVRSRFQAQLARKKERPIRTLGQSVREKKTKIHHVINFFSADHRRWKIGFSKIKALFHELLKKRWKIGEQNGSELVSDIRGIHLQDCLSENISSNCSFEQLITHMFVSVTDAVSSRHLGKLFFFNDSTIVSSLAERCRMF